LKHSSTTLPRRTLNKTEKFVAKGRKVELLLKRSLKQRQEPGRFKMKTVMQVEVSVNDSVRVSQGAGRLVHRPTLSDKGVGSNERS